MEGPFRALRAPGALVAWVTREIGDPTTKRAAGRLSSVLFTLCGVLVAVTAPLPAAPGTNRWGLVVVGVTAAIAGLVIWRLPWERWPEPTTLVVLLPLALALIDVHNVMAATDGFRYVLFFVVCYAWVGLAHPPGVSLLTSPLLVIAYVVPLHVTGRATDAVVASLAYAVPACVLVGEAAAAVASRLRRSDQAVRESEQRWRSLVMNASDLIVVIAADGTIQYATPAVSRLFGYSEDETPGMQVLDHIHPDDLAFVLDRLARSVATAATGELIEFRVRRWDGEYTWVESIGTNLLDEPTVEGIVCNVRDISERKQAEAELNRQARVDGLTGLPNRFALLEAIDGRASQDGAPFALLVMDLDGFKVVNDALGHETGDEVLTEVATRLPRAVPAGATVARLGGDEFALLFETPSADDAGAWAARLCAIVDAQVAVQNRLLRVGCSIGVAWSDGPADASRLLRQADVAMYRAKAARSGWAIYSSEDDNASARRLALANDLRAALDAGAIDVHYQPQVELESGRVLQVEALARWTRGNEAVSPLEFVPLAESTGMIGRLTDIVLQKALRQRRELAAEGSPVSVSVNVSARCLADPNFPRSVEIALQAADVPASALTLEITETALADDIESAANALHRLENLGVRLSIDDFGTGYSSMSYLRRLPIHELKIDRSFVIDLDRDARALPIAQAIVQLAHALGLAVVAEGVESEGLVSILGQLGCDAVQGYGLARPMTGTSLRTWLGEPALAAT